MHTYSRTLTAILAALVASGMFAVTAAPAGAQQEPVDGVTDPRFANEETRQLSGEVRAAESEYAANERRIEQLEAASDYGPERDRLMDANAEMDDANPALREDLVAARLDAIEDADAPSADKEDALESLERYAENDLEYGADVGDDVSTALSETEDAAEAEEAAQEAEEQAAQEEDQGDGGAAAPSGSGAESGGGDSGGGGEAPAPDPDSGGGISVFSGLFLLAIVGGVGWFLMKQLGAPGGGLIEGAKTLFKPDMATTPRESTAAPQRPSKSSQTKEQQATPDGAGDGSDVPENGSGSSSGSPDLNPDTDDVVRGSGGSEDPSGETPGDGSGSGPDSGPGPSGGPDTPEDEPDSDPDPGPEKPEPRPAQPTYLEQYTTSYADLVAAGKIQPVVGRDEEVEQVVEVLNRTEKPNPVLLGEAGVGKTAVVEGLARKLAEGTALGLEAEILELNLGKIEAGASGRGDYEERIEGVIADARTHGVILFVDEIHRLMGSGGTGGNEAGGAELLKPALARGDLRVIGASTPGEYRYKIERDEALARRFTPIKVEPLTVEQTIEVLHRRRAKYEAGVLAISDEALSAAADYSERYIRDMNLPDKALDLVDTAASRARTRGETKVGEPEIRDVVKRRTGINPGSPADSEADQLAALESNLNEAIKGQPAAVATVAQAIQSNRYMPDEKKPVSFLCAGPSGVGKTELARRLAKLLFGDEEAMTRLDMSEYQDKHYVSKLVGSSRGYIDSDKGGDLTNPIRKRPYSVLLLDEIEKAHPEVLTPMLQVLDAGRLGDNMGHTVDFRHTIVMMTTNAGAAEIAAASEAGEAPPVDAVKEALQRAGVRPEWVGRVGNICAFSPLSLDALREIAELSLQQAAERAKNSGVTLTWTAPAADLIARLGHDPQYGARPLQAVVQKQVIEGVTQALVGREIQAGDTAVVEAEPEHERVVIRREEGSSDQPPDDGPGPEDPGDGGPGGGGSGGKDTPARRRRRGPEDYPDEGPGGAPGNPFGR